MRSNDLDGLTSWKFSMAQANRHVPETYLVCGTASDGVIEAIESKSHQFVLGVQWHPENMAIAGDEPSLGIFKGFIEACTEEGDE